MSCLLFSSAYCIVMVQEQLNASLFCCLSIWLYPQLSISYMSEGGAIFAGTVLAKRGRKSMKQISEEENRSRRLYIIIRSQCPKL
jgi:hypothetical protein